MISLYIIAIWSFQCSYRPNLWFVAESPNEKSLTKAPTMVFLCRFIYPDTRDQNQLLWENNSFSQEIHKCFPLYTNSTVQSHYGIIRRLKDRQPESIGHQCVLMQQCLRPFSWSMTQYYCAYRRGIISGKLLPRTFDGRGTWWVGCQLHIGLLHRTY